jgi:hypothetical protein
VGLNHRPTVYETVALPLSYAGSRQDTGKSENQILSANLAESMANGVVYTFRHLVSSTKETMSNTAERMSMKNTLPSRMSTSPFH